MSTLKRFKKHYDGAPYELDDFAKSAADITDCPELSQAAAAYLSAQQAFRNALEEQNIEIG